MKRLILPAALAVVLSGSLAFAQQSPAPIERPDAAQAQQPAPDVQQPAHQHRAPNPNRETKRLTKQLNLTTDQASKVEPIIADRDQKTAALAADTTLSPDARRAQMKALHHDSEKQLAAILTPDQLQQMKSMHRKGHRGGPEGSPDSAPPQSAPPSAS